jgi:hypothetical protein
VEVAVGKAGTGKAYALDPAREAWQALRMRVAGAGLAVRYDRTRQLARLLDHAEQQLKVVLVGDRKQLPEVDPGGLSCALLRRLPAIELRGIRRQHTSGNRPRSTNYATATPHRARRLLP